MKLTPIAATAMLLATPPSFAFEDKESGLVIDLSADFEVSETYVPEIPPPGRVFAITSRNPAISPELSGEVCKVAFVPGVERSKLTQAELNNVMAHPIILGSAGAIVGPGAKVISVDTVSQNGLVGYEVVARYKGYADLLVLVSNFETPVGQMTLSCSAPETAFPDLRPIFEEIRVSVVPPG